MSDKNLSFLIIFPTVFYYRPVWLCSQCYVCYDKHDIEMRIIEVIQRKVMSYTLQDLICVKCKQIKRENMINYCSCAGNFQSLSSKDDLKTLLSITFQKIADLYEMPLLNELLANLNKSFH